MSLNEELKEMTIIGKTKQEEANIIKVNNIINSIIQCCKESASAGNDHVLIPSYAFHNFDSNIKAGLFSYYFTGPLEKAITILKSNIYKLRISGARKNSNIYLLVEWS